MADKRKPGDLNCQWLFLLMNKNTSRDRFRPDIQALRALAVVLVILYHFDLLATYGGYIGVDVFFVISGYLISSLLARELEERRRKAARC